MSETTARQKESKAAWQQHGSMAVRSNTHDGWQKARHHNIIYMYQQPRFDCTSAV